MTRKQKDRSAWTLLETLAAMLDGMTVRELTRFIDYLRRRARARGGRRS